MKHKALIFMAGLISSIEALLSPVAAETLSISALKAPSGYEGRIRLKRFLDEPDGYCLDVPGPHDQLQLSTPAWAHTCHFDALPDQVFKYNMDDNGQIRWVFQTHDLCLTANKLEKSARFKFSPCDEPRLQRFDVTDLGELKIRGGDLCLFVEGTGPYNDFKDPFGGGRPVHAPSSHLARFLELYPCGSGVPDMSRWRAFTQS
ncbi:RICIN domain-containing protein [Vibrio diabolicus]|uniref:RICIN domain-containing protein n=1 Tax=Vibrio diabolicus TaxID=50719 RepID=UPI00215C5B45|nr:RICIN domain-containing protein [Vibrio diabolicus]MCR9303048.1 RICIN domain-containing protein [Vibrio diabolicus]MCR9428463.1 RICIN domain-containing protein [Vibrio diabolicus]